MNAITVPKLRLRWIGRCWIQNIAREGKADTVRWLRRCWTCKKEFLRKPGVLNCDLCLVDFRHQAARAHATVSAAIKYGLLSKPDRYDCVDCGARAACYDHRDYRKPLTVDPVCRGCNGRRGKADFAEHAMS